MLHLLLEEECCLDADNFSAVFQHGIGQDTHQADLAAAVNKPMPVLPDPFTESFCLELIHLISAQTCTDKYSNIH